MSLNLPAIAKQVEEHAIKLTLLEQRVEEHDYQIGNVLKEASLAHQQSAAAHQIGCKVLDEVMMLRGLINDGFSQQQRECDIRHKPVDRRLDRLEDRSDAIVEGEITKVQGREALVKRAKGAESRVKLALITLAVTIVTTVGTVLSLWINSKVSPSQRPLEVPAASVTVSNP